MERRAKVELFEQIRREYEFGVGTIRGVARRLGVHRRMVRQAVKGALPPERKGVVREGLALVKKGVLEGGSMELVRSEMGTEPRAEEEPRPYPVRWFCIEPARRRRSPAPV
jgi:hypothetical protein